MAFRFDELLGYAQSIIIKADSMYLGNLQYWLCVWADEAGGKLSAYQYNKVVEELQKDGYHVLYSTIYKPRSEMYRKKKPGAG